MTNPTDRLVKSNSDKYKAAADNPLALARILTHIKYVGDCWVWTGATNGHGYGVGTSNKQVVYVHRLTRWIVFGPIEDGLVLDHLCRNPSCVNPLHTEAVTSAVNTARGAGHGSRTHCPAKHPYDETNTRVWVDKKGYSRRYCIECQNIRNAAYRQGKKSK